MAFKLIAIFTLLTTALSVGVYLAATHADKEPAGMALLNGSAGAQLSEQIPQKRSSGSNLPNATQAFAAELAQKLIEKNPTGPTLESAGSFISALDPNAAVDAAIADAVESIGYETFKTQVLFSELSVSGDASPLGIKNYFAAIETLLAKTREQIGSLSGTPSPSQFGAVANFLDGLIAGLKKVSVPKSIQNLHHAQIEILLTERNIFEAIGGADQDPVRSIAALQLLPIVIQELRAIEEKFIAVQKEYGIK